MLKVQLCPAQELEDKRWYLLDALIAGVFVVVTVAGMVFYLFELQDSIGALNTERQNFEAKQNSLKPQIEKVKNLDIQIAELQKKLIALKSITVSKIEKIKHIVALEHFQILRPAGVWFQSLVINDSLTFELQGSTFDTILVAELMMNLRDTEMFQDQGANIRNLIYFSDIKIKKTNYFPGIDSLFLDLQSFHNFTVEGTIVQRQEVKIENKLAKLINKKVRVL